jgi:hypothetical protein
MSEKPARRTVRCQSTAAEKPSIPIPEIEEAVKSIRFGIVQLIIQDGRVIQIDKTEKIRLA